MRAYQHCSTFDFSTLCFHFSSLFPFFPEKTTPREAFEQLQLTYTRAEKAQETIPSTDPPRVSLKRERVHRCRD